MNKKSNYDMIIGILFPFMHMYVLQSVKILHLTLAVVILLYAQNFRTRIQRLPLLFSFYLILSYAIGYVRFGQFDQASTLTLSGLAAILLAIFFPIMNNDIDRSKFIRGYVFGFAINSLINVYIYYRSSGAVSRISSWWSVGYSDVGQDLIAGQASFNEIGALTAIAAIFQLIAIFEKSSNSVLSRTRDIITLLLLVAGLILTGSRSATFAFLILAFHLYYLTLRTGHFKIPIFVWSIVPLFYYGGDIVVNRIMSVVTQPE